MDRSSSTGQLPTLYDGDFVSTWKTLEEFHRDGRARSIGVASNFQIEHWSSDAETDTVPAVNQIEANPLASPTTRRCASTARSTGSSRRRGRLSRRAGARRFHHEDVDKVGKTPAQVVLRWHIQRGDIVFPGR